MKAKLIRYFFLGFVITVVSACSATGPVFSEAPGPKKTDALVYIYRPDAIYYSGIQSHFYLNDVKVASLNKKGYTWFYAPKGDYALKQHWTGMDGENQIITRNIKLPPEGRVFYRLTIGLEDFRAQYPGFKATHSWVLSEVTESQALIEMRDTRFQPPFDLDKVIPQKR